MSAFHIYQVHKKDACGFVSYNLDTQQVFTVQFPAYFRTVHIDGNNDGASYICVSHCDTQNSVLIEEIRVARRAYTLHESEKIIFTEKGQITEKVSTEKKALFLSYFKREITIQDFTFECLEKCNKYKPILQAEYLEIKSNIKKSFLNF